MPKKSTAKASISESLEDLEQIVEWFDTQKEVDVEKGLEYVKKSAEIIKQLKSYIRNVENEFEEVKKSIGE